MPGRRAFLMTAISAAAMGAVAAAAALLRRGNPAETPPFDQPQQPAPTQSEDGIMLPSTLNIMPRAAWGAAEPRVFATGRGERAPYDPQVNPDGWLVYSQPAEEVIETLILHHSALPLTDGPLEIQRLHMEERGFADVGYQFLVDHDGQVYEGRAMNVRGAHTYAFNYGTIGVCLIGNFEEITPSASQLAALDLLIDWLVERLPRMSSLAGHQDFAQGVTLCPGKNFYPMLPAIAKEHGLAYGGA